MARSHQQVQMSWVDASMMMVLHPALLHLAVEFAAQRSVDRAYQRERHFL